MLEFLSEVQRCWLFFVAKTRANAQPSPFWHMVSHAACRNAKRGTREEWSQKLPVPVHFKPEFKRYTDTGRVVYTDTMRRQ